MPGGLHIPEGRLGGCQRYKNDGGQVTEARPLLLPEGVDLKERYRRALISSPLITAVGAGGTYPDYLPAPLAAKESLDGVGRGHRGHRVAPHLLQPAFQDRHRPLHRTGDGRGEIPGAKVGHVTTEQYGSKMISVGGINVMKGKSRLKAVRLIAAAANGETVKLTVEGGAKLELTVGQAPIIDGRPAQAMKIACGAAIVGIFAPAPPGSGRRDNRFGLGHHRAFQRGARGPCPGLQVAGA